MAGKKRKPGGDAPRKRRPPPSEGLAFDPRMLEAFMSQLAGGEGPAQPDTPLGRAQEIVSRAFEEPDERKRVRLAKKALAECPDCADAYVLLAEHTPRRKEALHLYEQATAAGERALGPETFHSAAGHFWGLLETRPYMRARLGLAHALWTAGRRDEAVRHLHDMLRLNPNDNQGVRYTLAGFLLFLDRDDDLGRLLDQFDEASATWLFTRALLAFRREGDTPAARKLLKAAVKENKHVPAYLTGEKFPEDGPPSYYSPGDESEAQEYVGGFLAGWKDTPGAVDWLNQTLARKPRKKKEGPPAKGPTPAVKKQLAKVPQTAAGWQAAVRQFPNWVRIGGRPIRPWVVLVTSADELVLGHHMTDEPPTAAQVWDVLTEAMRHPAAGKPHRPAELHVRDDDRWESLRPDLEAVGVGVVAAEGLGAIDAVFEELCEHVCGPAEPSLLDAPGVTPTMVGRFYEAAAFFFRQAPWKKVGYEAAIRVECGKFESGPWFAVLMGQSGLTTGLALYEDLAALQAMWAGDQGDEANARQTVATVVTFGEAWDVPVADLEAEQAHGWPVARADAHPRAFHKERGLSLRPPLAWELDLLAACLRAVPAFVARRQQDDPTRETMPTPGAAGDDLPLVLSWVVEEGA